MRALFPSILAITLSACSTHHAIIGEVMDRNGEPLDRVVVSLKPGGVEMVTDSEGRFVIDYLRNDSGERTKLGKRTDYEVEYFKAGYNIETANFYFKRGELLLEPVTLEEDTIRVTPSGDDIDPEKYPDRTHSAGTNYEGE